MSPVKPSVGLLGGSFDPVHHGHVAIARSFLSSDYISELWVLLTPESPHKTGQKSASYALRFQMLQSAFQEIDHVEISNIEQQLKPPYYTVQTLQYLTDQHNDRSFFLCMGEDSLINFRKWHRWRKILEYCNLLVASRPHYQSLQQSAKISQKAVYVDHQPLAISSSEIRDSIKKGNDISALVPAPVAQTIKQHGLYST